MGTRTRLSALLTALLFGVAASVSLAQVRPGVDPVDPRPLPRPIRTPLPLPGLTPAPVSASPGATATPSARTIPGGAGMVLPGQRVPLSALPPLPSKTVANTAYFELGGHGRRPMMANGSQINFSADTAGNTNCSSAVGTIIPIGCDVKWNSATLQPGGQTWQDYFINYNTSTATAAGAQYGGGGGPQRCDASSVCPDSTGLTATGTYVLATYNVTANQWGPVVYVSVGNINVFGTYADSAATTPQTQFTAANGTNVYVNATGLTQGQLYVVYVESTSSNVYCAYIAPPGSATPNPNGFCDPTTSPGITAVVGAQSSAAITAVWPLSNTTPTGTYSVVLYNLTTKTRLAMRQVSIVASGTSASVTFTPVAGNPAPGGAFQYPPSNPGTPYAATTSFAFDNQQEQSDKGFTETATGLSPNTQYTIAINDPTGSIENNSTNQSTNGSGQITWNPPNFTNQQSPSNFVAHTYTMTFYNKTTGNVDLSQSYQILGYNVTTDFTNPTGTALALATGGQATNGLSFTNTGDSVFGTGNGDTISQIAWDSGGNGVTADLNTAQTACGANCIQETTTATDTSGQTWNVTDTCNLVPGNGGCTIVANPAVSTQSLAINATLTINNITFTNPSTGHCTNGCSAQTIVLPAHGVTWSQTNQSYATNPVYFTNGKNGVPTGTASVTHYGYFDNAGNVFSGQETHGYTYNNGQMTYTTTSPFNTLSGYGDEWHMVASNTSPIGTNPITQIEVQLPAAYSPGGTLTAVTVDQALSPGWKTVNCPAGAPSSAFCVQNANGNAGIAVGATQDIYVQLAPPPPAAYSYTDWVVQAIKPTIFALSPSGSITGFVPNTTPYDNTATAAYSLTASLITPAFAPTSAGQNTNNSMTIDVTNTSTAQDPFPDYLDAITIDLPSTNAFSSLSGMPTGWSLLGTSTPVAGTTRYWFGLCAAQFNTADGPVSNPPPVNATLPSCGAAIEQSAVIPGSTFSVTGNLQTGTSNITGTMYAHGANGAAWSQGHTFTLSVTAVSAAVGFSAAGGYPTATTVSSPNTPQIGADSNATYGNVFSYVIKNTSGTGQNITSAKIVIPGLDVSSVLPPDGTAWTLTNTPAISGTAYSCSVTSSTSANRTGANNGYGAYNGGITIGGASCSIPPGSSITVTFDAKAPYTVNDSYQFTTTVNGATSAAEMWQTDTFVQIILSANLVVTVNPGNPGPGGSNPSVSCPVCTFNTGTNTIDYGNVANPGSVVGSDVVRVSIFTNAGSNNAWKLYVDTNNNPANTGGTYLNELLTSIDSTHSAPTGGINFDQTAYKEVPTASPGLLLMDNGTGVAASRTPFDAIMNFQININGGPTTPQISTVTYTFIAN
jgi:hypothetical protein